MYRNSITWSHGKSNIVHLMLLVVLIVPRFSALLAEQQVVQDNVAYHLLFLCLFSYYWACCFRLTTPMDILYSVSKGLESSFSTAYTLKDTYLTDPSFPVCKLPTTPTFRWLRGVSSCMRTTSPITMSPVFLFDVFFR